MEFVAQVLVSTHVVKHCRAGRRGIFNDLLRCHKRNHDEQLRKAAAYEASENQRVGAEKMSAELRRNVELAEGLHAFMSAGAVFLAFMA